MFNISHLDRIQAPGRGQSRRLDWVQAPGRSQSRRLDCHPDRNFTISFLAEINKCNVPINSHAFWKMFYHIITNLKI